jgi:prolyl 4-hydroxylase
VQEHHATVAELDRRIANVTGLFEGNSEHYQVLRYQPPDQFYKAHSDFISSQVGQDCGPRLFTFFLYLADVKDGMGGETFFPQAQSLAEEGRPPCNGGMHHVTFADEVDCGLLVKPKKRSAVLWPNVDLENFEYQNAKTTHAALAIKEECGVDDAEHCFKWAANVWIHAFDFKGAHGAGRTG